MEDANDVDAAGDTDGSALGCNAVTSGRSFGGSECGLDGQPSQTSTEMHGLLSGDSFTALYVRGHLLAEGGRLHTNSSSRLRDAEASLVDKMIGHGELVRGE